MESKKMSTSLSENMNYLNDYLSVGTNFDIVYRVIRIGGREACMYFIDGFCKDELMQKMLQYFMDIKEEEMPGSAHEMSKTSLPYVEVDLKDDWDQITYFIMSGVFALFVDGYDKCLLIDSRTYPARSVSEPEKDKVLRGSKDGFVETIVFNTALIRRRIRSCELRMEMLHAGNSSQTDIVLCYMDTRVDHNFLNKLKQRISEIQVDALTMNQEIMEAEPDNPQTVRQFTARMGASLKRMEQLIFSMLKITRLDAGNISFEKDICNVKELIAGAVGELTVKAGKEGKKILLEGNPEQTLVCDREWTGEAIGNIVKNALDHTRSGDRIHISWERTPAMLRILVADSGQGIAPEDIHHIFKRFYRSAHSLDTQGVGLGLSLAKSIVEGQGGILAAQSEPGQGALFTMSFLTEL